MSLSIRLALLGAVAIAIALIVVLAFNGFARQNQVGSRATAVPLSALSGNTAPLPLSTQPTNVVAAASTASPPVATQPIIDSTAQTIVPAEQSTAAVVIEPAIPVFYDDFSRVNSGWSPFYLDDAGNVNGYSAETYQLRSTTADLPLYDIRPPLPFRPSSYAIDVRADGDGSYGLLLGVQGDPTQFASLSYLLVALNSTGQVVIALREPNAAMSIIEQSNTGFALYGDDIHLEVAQQSDGLQVVVNGSDVVFAPDVRIPDGTIGLYATALNTGIQVTFDNLIVLENQRGSVPVCTSLRSLPLASAAIQPSGDDVAVLQARLAHLGYAASVSGEYDARTQNATQLFQRQNNLNEPNIGPETWCRLLSRAAINADGRSEAEAGQQQFRPIVVETTAGLDVPLLSSIRQEDKIWQIALALPGDDTVFYIDTDGDALDPVWSPDRRWLAFTSSRSGTDAVWTLDVTNGRLQQVSPQGRVAQYPVWSPDSRVLLYTDEPGPDRPNAARLYLYDIETAQTQLLIDQHSGWADWSVNNEIVFSGWSGKSYDLFRINPDGSGLANLTNTDDRHEDIAGWSPDGTLLAFVANPKDNLAERQIFVRDREGVGERQLIADAGPNSNPTWLSNTLIAFANQPAPDVWQPWLVDTNGGTPRQLSRNAGRIWFMNRVLPG